jgi:hypothetical protein
MTTLADSIQKIRATGKPGMLTAPNGFPLCLVRPDDTDEKLREQLVWTLDFYLNTIYKYPISGRGFSYTYSGDLDSSSYN